MAWRRGDPLGQLCLPGPGPALYAGAVTCGGLKWHILLRAQGDRRPFLACCGYTFVGVFFNNFLPANVGGDVMRGLRPGSRHRPGGGVRRVVVVDRSGGAASPS